MTDSVCLLYIHIGKSFPQYIFDNLYQTLLINGDDCKIYVVLDDVHIDNFNRELETFSTQLYHRYPCNVVNVVNVFPLSMLQSKLLASTTFKEYTNAIEKQHSLMTDFRDGFWISTTSRFFYIGVLMSELRLTNVFHIENDIIIYKSFRSIFEENKQHKGAIWMVQDSPHRVVPSLLFFPNATAVDSLTTFIASEFTKSPHFINDMDILGRYQPKHALNILPDKGNVVYDGAAIGQYLGGVDDRNIPSNQDAKRPFRNPLIGFVNETSAFKPDTCTFSKANVSKEHLVTPVKCVIGVSNTTKKTFTVSNVQNQIPLDYKKI